MKRMIVTLLLAILSLSAIAQTTKAQVANAQLQTETMAATKFVPPMSYQGLITDKSGKALTNGEYDVEFKLFNSAEKGDAVWSEVQKIKIEDGVINAVLGLNKKVELPFDQQYWLSVTVNKEEMPRQILTASPYVAGNSVKTINGATGDVEIVGGNGISVEKSKDGKIVIGGDDVLRSDKIDVSKGAWNTATSGYVSTTDKVVVGSTITTGHDADLNLVDRGWGLKITNAFSTGFIGKKWHINTRDGGLNFCETSSGDWKMFIAPNGGFVGIGTSTPQSRLTVNGDIRLGEYQKNQWILHAPPTGTALCIAPRKADGSEMWKSQVVIHNDGKVVIGNGIDIFGTPYDNAQLTVNGKIAAEEIVVVANVASASGSKDDGKAWPDYVFSPDYKMMSLDQVEDYIETNNHLPGVPSAAEIGKTGIRLGDMQRVYMEKIEELTLHLIEQNKKIDALEKRLNGTK